MLIYFFETSYVLENLRLGGATFSSSKSIRDENVNFQIGVDINPQSLHKSVVLHLLLFFVAVLPFHVRKHKNL